MGIKDKVRNVFFVLILSILSFNSFTACNNQSITTDNKTSVIESDSILVWIEAGRNNDNSNIVRNENLLRAYNATNSQKVDSFKVKYLSKIQWSFLGVQDSVWFRKTNKEANLLAQKIGDSLRLAGSYWDLAIFLSHNKVKDSAYYHFGNAKKIYEALGNNLNAGKLEYDMAVIQTEVKNYTSGEVNAIKAIELLKPLRENIMLYRCYNQLGIISKDLANYEKSLEYYEIAMSYLEKSNAKSTFASVLENNIGVTYQKKEDYKKAVTYFEKVLNEEGLFIKNPEFYSRALSNLAKSYNRLDPEEKEVEGMFLRSLKIRDSLEDIFAMAGGYYELSEYYLEKKDSAKALETASEAKFYAELSDNNERLLESLAMLTQLDSKNAPIYGQRYMTLNDSLQREERKIRNKFARIRFETDEVVAENKSLARQKQFWVGIALAILLLGAAGYMVVDQKSKNQKLRFLQEQQLSNEKIFNLMLSEKQKFEEGKKIEQKRISEELHDGVLGKMLGARMVLTGLNKKNGEEAISERADAIVALKNVEGEVRSISHELSHAAYQEIHNFIRSIGDLIKNSAEAANINHTFNYTDEVDWDDLSGDIKINVYRIVQESLQNAVKHSQCTNIKLDFSMENDELKIEIADDGVGFVLNKKKRKGIGMRNLQSRINKLDGKWQIDSKPGKGTSVILSIPIKYFSKNPKIFDEAKKVEKV